MGPTVNVVSGFQRLKTEYIEAKRRVQEPEYNAVLSEPEGAVEDGYFLVADENHCNHIQRSTYALTTENQLSSYTVP